MASRFLDGAQSKRVLALATPVIFAMLTQTTVNIVDTYFLKKLPCADASDAQAALTPALMLLWAVGGFLSSVSVGTLAIAARRFGEERHEAAGAVVLNAVLIALVGGTVAGIAGWIAMPRMFAAIVSSPHVAHLGTLYTRWRFLAIVPMAATAAYKAFFDGIGKTHFHLWAAVAMNIVNVALCWLLIFGHWGFPRMGIEGAGIAAGASSWIGMLVMIGFSLRGKFRSKFRFYRPGNVSGRLVWDILKLSVPGGLATVAVMSGFLLFTKIVARLDAGAVQMVVQHASECGGVRVAVNGAATTIIIEVLSATFVSCLAFGTATATLVGQSLGQGQPALAQSYAWTSVKLGIFIFGGLGGLIYWQAPAVMGVFSDAPAVIAAGVPPLRLVSAGGWMLAIGMILMQALFGAGDTRYVLMVELGLHFGCLVPLAWVFGMIMNWGLIGVWSSAGVYVAFLAVFMAVRFQLGGWKHLKV